MRSVFDSFDPAAEEERRVRQKLCGWEDRTFLGPRKGGAPEGTLPHPGCATELSHMQVALGDVEDLERIRFAEETVRAFAQERESIAAKGGVLLCLVRRAPGGEAEAYLTFELFVHSASRDLVVAIVGAASRTDGQGHCSALLRRARSFPTPNGEQPVLLVQSSRQAFPFWTRQMPFVSPPLPESLPLTPVAVFLSPVAASLSKQLVRKGHTLHFDCTPLLSRLPHSSSAARSLARAASALSSLSALASRLDFYHAPPPTPRPPLPPAAAAPPLPAETPRRTPATPASRPAAAAPLLGAPLLAESSRPRKALLRPAAADAASTGASTSPATAHANDRTAAHDLAACVKGSASPEQKEVLCTKCNTVTLVEGDAARTEAMARCRNQRCNLLLRMHGLRLDERMGGQAFLRKHSTALHPRGR